MKILITGGNGFLGGYMRDAWDQLGYETVSIGKSKKNRIQCDLSHEIPVIPESFDYVIHAAGKAHIIPKNETEKKEFHSINVIGTENLLKGLEKSTPKPKALLFVSSASVYGKQTGKLIKEESYLSAEDPYGKSKIEGEKLVLEWGKKHNISVSIIRPPLIIGKNAPGNLKQMINAIKSGKYRNIDGGKAKRSMVFAEDIANFSPALMRHAGIYNLTDGVDPSFKELSFLIGNRLGKKVYNLPLSLAKFVAFCGNVLGVVFRREMPFSSQKLFKMTNSLTLDSAKAKSIGWTPRSVLKHPELWI